MWLGSHVSCQTNIQGSGALTANSGIVNIGRYLYDQNQKYGIFTVDEILIWNSALSNDEVATIPG